MSVGCTPQASRLDPATGVATLLPTKSLPVWLLKSLACLTCVFQVDGQMPVVGAVAVTVNLTKPPVGTPEPFGPVLFPVIVRVVAS
jgi:hypothetical protein